MKKILALLVAALLTVCLTVSVFAAENTPSPKIGPGKDISAADDATTVAYNKDGEAARLALDDAVKANGGGDIAYLVDVTASGNTAKLKFAMPAGKELAYVLHWDGAKWEKVDASYADGVLTITVKAWSPVAVVLKNATNSDGTSPVAPQTGEVATSIYAVSAAVMAVAAAAFVVKSKKAA